MAVFTVEVWFYYGRFDKDSEQYEIEAETEEEAHKLARLNHRLPIGTFTINKK